MVTLITTKGCGQCIVAMNALNKAGVEYKKVYADTEEGSRMVDEYDIHSAPTLILESNEVFRNLNSILTYANAHKK